MKQTVVLAYSGGLDTSVAIPWLADQGYDVVALAVDVGANVDLPSIQAKATAIGARRCYVVDARDHFAEHFILPSLRAHALYEGIYPLSAALSRPLIAELLVAVAHREGATAVAHGCTGKGNDQVRFDVAIGALDPSLKVIAPVREWAFSRDTEIRYAAERGIPIPVTIDSPYSIDVNIWGRSVESGLLEDPAHPVPEDAWEWTRPAGSAEASEVTLTFDCGRPVALNGRRLGLPALIAELNQLAGQAGVGRIDMVENRLVGIKSREVYEAPAAVTLMTAARSLEQLVLTRELGRLKMSLEHPYATLAYEGLWYSPARDALDAFMTEATKAVSGEVTVALDHGQATVVSRTAPQTLYQPRLATYGDDDQFDHKSAEGFVTLWGLPIRTLARVAPVAPASLDGLPVTVSEAHQHA